MIEINMYTSCISITNTDDVVKILNYLGIRYSEMRFRSRNMNSMLIVDIDHMIPVAQELLRLQNKIVLRKG